MQSLVWEENSKRKTINEKPKTILRSYQKYPNDHYEDCSNFAPDIQE